MREFFIYYFCGWQGSIEVVFADSPQAAVDRFRSVSAAPVFKVIELVQVEDWE